MLQREKLLQAKGILKETDIDLWITLVRETEQTPDPVLPLISTVDYTWVSALMVTKSGRSIALVGNHDEEGTRQMGVWDEVYGYQEDFTPAFARLLHETGAASIALNYSKDLPAADGLSHGLYLYFVELLQKVGFHGQVHSAGEVIRRLRGQKTATEVHLIEGAITTAQTIFDTAVEQIHVGMSEIDIYNYFQGQLKEHKVLPAWLPAQCPGVMAGPKTALGHNGPSLITIAPGDVITIDFGVEQREYCSDLQRVYFVRNEGTAASGVTVPEEVQNAFDTVRRAVEKAAKFMKPGVTGVQVDTVARDYVTSQGYPAWTYALGHEVGRKAHDGGAVLGPRWDRYAGVIDLPLLIGNVFTLELGVPTSRGYVGLEEMVQMTETGARFLSVPQQTPYIVG